MVIHFPNIVKFTFGIISLIQAILKSIATLMGELTKNYFFCLTKFIKTERFINHVVILQTLLVSSTYKYILVNV